ncbi:MAG: NADAR family protein [Candidatus Heimdallarchaeota archaeon]|nr:NADAR family protein [Candidatus Heimdallarchaeota archaeon]
MINQFKDKYFFLSNFYPSKMNIDGEEYATVEHYFQAMKANNSKQRMEIQNAKTPQIARRLGRKCNLIKGWEKIKLDVMEKALRVKFTNNELRRLLIETGDEELIEGNHWGDEYWGLVLSSGIGENHAGKLLMKIRNELQLTLINDI